MNDFDDYKNWHKETILTKLNDKLKKKDFNSIILNTGKEINDFIMKTIPKDSTVGIGGSVTVRELGIDSFLKERGNTMFNHWDKALTQEQMLDVRRKQLSSDYFLTSVNAVTIDGQLVNIDGVGNRVASMIFGPKHVIAVIGINKIAKNIDEAVWRIKNIATPMNCKRLGIEAPCVSSGYCVECKFSNSVCKITTIIDSRPIFTEFTIILTPMELGF